MSMIRPAFFKSEEEIQKNTENAFNEYNKFNNIKVFQINYAVQC